MIHYLSYFWNQYPNQLSVTGMFLIMIVFVWVMARWVAKRVIHVLELNYEVFRSFHANLLTNTDAMIRRQNALYLTRIDTIVKHAIEWRNWSDTFIKDMQKALNTSVEIDNRNVAEANKSYLILTKMITDKISDLKLVRLIMEPKKSTIKKKTPTKTLTKNRNAK